MNLGFARVFLEVGFPLLRVLILFWRQPVFTVRILPRYALRLNLLACFEHLEHFGPSLIGRLHYQEGQRKANRLAALQSPVSRCVLRAVFYSGFVA
jgi:hypothetical protein